jgi:single-stranded-DNA-specific exonuclease
VSRIAKAWQLLPNDPSAVRRLARSLAVPEVAAQLLINRGLRDPDQARRFLDPSLSGLHPPEQLPGVPEAAERIGQAIQAGRTICIYGDYDVDGMTGTALLVRLIQSLQGKVVYHIPHRLDDGYGLSDGALREIRAGDVSLVVTVDCGITGTAEAVTARELGLELIITDHHEMKAELPSADVLVHPRLPGSTYPFAGLSGAGVAFKLAWAVCKWVSGGDKVRPELREFLLDATALAALGLIADVMPLTDENRILVRHGLARLRTHPSLGLKALLDVAKLGDAKTVRAEDVGFRLGPRLNAVGRLGFARLGVELLTTTSPPKAHELAHVLEARNAERQTLERRLSTQAHEQIETHRWEDEAALVLAGHDWHAGVIGIVAGRLVEQYGRPAILLALREGSALASGSGRSIAGIPLHEALAACGDLLEGFGGHAAAAGLRIRTDRIDAFRDRFAGYVREQFPDGLPAPRLTLDAEVPLSALTHKLVRDLDHLEPYGSANPKPKLLAGDLEIIGDPRRIGQGERHLSFRVRQGGSSLRAVAFGMGERLDELMSEGGRCCLAFTPQISEWNGYSNVELLVADFQAGAQARLT